MKHKDVQVGKTYAVKVSGRIVPVLITRADEEWGGWWGYNHLTVHGVRIRSAARLRFEVIQVNGKWVPVAFVKRSKGGDQPVAVGADKAEAARTGGDEYAMLEAELRAEQVK